MYRSVDIYIRRDDGIYVIPYGLTTQGFDYLTEPFEHLPLGTPAAELWLAVQRALENTNRIVPHPDNWDVITPWYRKAGVKTWRQFGSKAKAVNVTEIDHEYVIRVLRWDGRGFEGSRDRKYPVPKSACPEDVLAVFEKALQEAMES